MHIITLFCVTFLGLGLIGGFSTAGYTNWKPVLTSSDVPLPTPLDYLIWSLNSFYTFNRASMQKLEVNETIANVMNVKKLFVDEMDVRNITFLEGITSINGVPTLNSSNVLTDFNVAGTTNTKTLTVKGTSTLNDTTTTRLDSTGPITAIGSISANGPVSGTSIQSFGPIDSTGTITGVTLTSFGNLNIGGNSFFTGPMRAFEAVQIDRELLVLRDAVFGQELGAVGNITTSNGYLKGGNAEILGRTTTTDLTVTNTINALGGVTTNQPSSFGDVFMTTSSILRTNFIRTRDNGDFLRIDPGAGGKVVFENLPLGGVEFTSRADANLNTHWISAAYGSSSRSGKVVIGNLYDSFSSQNRLVIGGHIDNLGGWENLFINPGASTIIGRADVSLGLPTNIGILTTTPTTPTDPPSLIGTAPSFGGPTAKLAVEGLTILKGSLLVGSPGADGFATFYKQILATSGVNSPSDPRVKKNIVLANETLSLEKIMRVPIYNYQYQDFFANITGVNNSKVVTGFIAANELLTEFPEAFETFHLGSANNISTVYNSIDKQKLFAHTWGAIRELGRENIRLREKIVLQDTVISQILGRLNALENPPA